MSGLMRVVGIGSRHGDDAVGLAALQQLQMTIGDKAEVEFHAVDCGQRLLDLLDGHGKLILIDALQCSRGSPGTTHRLVWPDPRIDALQPGSTHALGLAQALQLAAALGQLPEEVVVYAMEIDRAEPGQGLGPAVFRSLPELVALVLAEIESMRTTVESESGRS